MDSNHRRRKPADLQSALVGHLSILPARGAERRDSTSERQAHFSPPVDRCARTSPILPRTPRALAHRSASPRACAHVLAGGTTGRGVRRRAAAAARGGRGGGGGAPIENGKLYNGRITGIKDFGAFVECTPGKEGLCHISELADFRVRRTEDVVKMGEMIWVKCIGIDERSGKVRLSRKAAMKEMEGQNQGGGQAAPAAPAPQA